MSSWETIANALQRIAFAQQITLLRLTARLTHTAQKPTITFTEADIRGGDTVRLLSRFGAACVQYHGSFILLGGVGCDGLISREDDIVLFSTSGSRIEAISRLVPPLTDIPRPLIVGSSVVDDDGDLVLIGGAATCFSVRILQK